jgi:adenine-specific DNA methylase
MEYVQISGRGLALASCERVRGTMSEAEESEEQSERTVIDVAQDGGDSACWANLVCPVCGSMIENDDHIHGPAFDLE